MKTTDKMTNLPGAASRRVPVYDLDVNETSLYQSYCYGRDFDYAGTSDDARRRLGEVIDSPYRNAAATWLGVLHRCLEMEDGR